MNSRSGADSVAARLGTLRMT